MYEWIAFAIIVILLILGALLFCNDNCSKTCMNKGNTMKDPPANNGLTIVNSSLYPNTYAMNNSLNPTIGLTRSIQPSNRSCQIILTKQLPSDVKQELASFAALSSGNPNGTQKILVCNNLPCSGTTSCEYSIATDQRFINSKGISAIMGSVDQTVCGDCLQYINFYCRYPIGGELII